MSDEAVVRIVLDDAGGVHSAPPPSAAPSRPPAPPPAMSPADARARDTYQGIAAAIGQARRDAEAFGRAVEGVQGRLFQLRYGVDPEMIAGVFSKGGEAAADLIHQLGKINALLETGGIGAGERLQLAREAVADAAAASVQPPPPQQRDFMSSLINPAEGANPHVLLEGQSGSGKSLAAKHITFERMRQGQEVHVVDTHTPEAWGGAKQVFQGTNEEAGKAAADFLREALESRKAQKAESLARGEQPDFTPMTVVFSDFARLMKDTPELGEEFKTLLTEARKFRISIIADTTALTGASSGIKGIQDVLNNFGQKVKFFAPTAQGDPRRAVVGGETFATPQLPDYLERVDYGLIKPPAPPKPPPEEPFDPLAVAKERIKREEERAAVDAEYAKLKPPAPPKPEPTALDVAKKRVEAEEFRKKVDAEYKKINPEEPLSGLDSFLKVAEAMRGTLGGSFGRLVGAGLDIAAGARDVNTAAAGGSMVEVAEAAMPLIAGIKGAKDAITGAVKGALQGVTSPDEDPSKAMEGIGSAINNLGQMTMNPLLQIAGSTLEISSWLMDNFSRLADKYAPYNSDISQAQAMAEMTQEMGNMRRAQESGGELAEFLKQQSELTQKFEDAKMAVWIRILPVLNAVLNGLNMILSIIPGNRDMEDIVDPTTIILGGEVNGRFNSPAVSRAREGSTGGGSVIQ